LCLDDGETTSFGRKQAIGNGAGVFDKQVFPERRGLLISTAKNQQVATSLAAEFLERLSTGPQTDSHFCYGPTVITSKPAKR
jgi:hypothetical protein